MSTSSTFLLIIALLLTSEVASAETLNEHTQSAPKPALTVLSSAVDRISEAGAAWGRLQSTANSTADASQPTIIWMRISEDYLARLVERDVDRTKAVHDNILGTRIEGQSRTRGKTHLVLHPNDARAAGEIVFIGTVRADTVGRNGPAILHYDSRSTFKATKQLTIGQQGITVAPARVQAPTRLTLTSIDSTMPGLRGRFVERIARRRAAQSSSRANAVASEHTADDIRSILNEKLNASIARVQTTLEAHLAELSDKENHRPLMRSRSMADGIEIALYHPRPDGTAPPMPSFDVAGNPDIAVRVHRTLAPRLMQSVSLRQKLSPALAGMIMGQLTGQSESQRDSAPGPASFQLEGDWIVCSIHAEQKISMPTTTPRLAASQEAAAARR